MVWVPTMFVVLLATGELTARLAWRLPPALIDFAVSPCYRAPAPDTWEPVPGYRGEVWIQAAGGWRRCDLRTNSLGLRGAELPPPQPGELRLLALGDSLIFGHAVDEAASIPDLTAALLRDDGVPMIACNGGVPGYGLRASRQRLERLLPAVAPGVIVVGLYLGNDLLDDLRKHEVEVIGGRVFFNTMARLMRTQPRARLAVYSRLWLWLEYQLLLNAPHRSLLAGFVAAPGIASREAGLPPHHQCVASLFLDAADPQRVFRPGAAPPLPQLLADLAAELDALRRAATATPLLLVLLPARHHVDDALRARTLQEVGLGPADCRPGLLQARVLAACAAAGVPALDVTPLLRGAGDPAVLFQEDLAHLTDAGNAVVARAVAARLRTMLRG